MLEQLLPKAHLPEESKLDLLPDLLHLQGPGALLGRGKGSELAPQFAIWIGVEGELPSFPQEPKLSPIQSTNIRRTRIKVARDQGEIPRTTLPGDANQPCVHKWNKDLEDCFGVDETYQASTLGGDFET